MSTELIIAAAIFLVSVLVTVASYLREKNSWNQGYCPECGGEWERFDTDSQGGRGYKCSNGHTVWISWKRVDL